MFCDRPTHTSGWRKRHRSLAALVGVALTASLALGAVVDAAVAGPPDDSMVDLAVPTFSNPTSITNPLFPISELEQVVQLGTEAGHDLRNEVTLLPETRTIEWNNQQVETLVSQFVAYQDGRVLEVAVDFFAQADDGAVWYFGEDVSNYKNGVIDNTEGTWLAGRDGPPGMIMPADPRVGDVYRPENIPGFVFEEVTVKEVDKTVAGPRGPVKGAVVVEELLMDGLREGKTFAPGYGEFAFEVKAEKESAGMGLAVPTDSLSEPVPAALSTISSTAHRLFETAPSKQWGRISRTARTLSKAWTGYRTGDVPKRLGAQMDAAVDALKQAVGRKDPSAVRQAALDVWDAELDLTLQFESPADVDRARLGVWARQVILDAENEKLALVAGDVAIIEAINTRVGHLLDAPAATAVNAAIGPLRASADARDTAGAAEHATALQNALAEG